MTVAAPAFLAVGFLVTFSVGLPVAPLATVIVFAADCDAVKAS